VIAAKMMIPPIVGVPALVWWPWGPSSRMFWPNSRRRRKAMNLGLRNRHISSEAVPAIRIGPEAEPVLMLPPRRRAPRRPASGPPQRALDQHQVAILEQLGHDRRGLGGVGDRLRFPAKALRGRGASGPTVTSTSTPAASASSPSSRW